MNHEKDPDNGKSIKTEGNTDGRRNGGSADTESGRNVESTVHTGDAGNVESTVNMRDERDAESMGKVGNGRDAESVGNMCGEEYEESTGSREVMVTEDAESKCTVGNRRIMRSRKSMENTLKKKKLTGSFVAKTAAFFLLAGCTFVAVISACTALYMAPLNYYNSDFAEIFLSECSGTLLNDIWRVRDYIASGDLGYAKDVCEGKNVDIALLQGDLWKDNGSATDNPVLIWTTYKGSYDVSLTQDYYIQFPAVSLTGSQVVNYHKIYAQKDYVFRAYFNMDFPEKDQYAEIYNKCLALYDLRYTVLWILVISVFLGLNSFLFLMCSAGHRNDAEGILPSIFSGMPLDLYTAGYGVVAVFLLWLMANLFNYALDDFADILAFAVVTSAEVLWCTFYLRELVLRLKLGDWWRNTVIYRLLRFAGKILRFLGRGICSMFRGIPLILNTMIIFCGITILEFFGMAVLSMRGSVLVVCWGLKKMILLPAVVYIALTCKRLLEGSRAIAEGRQEMRVDTSSMFGDFRECGENLNNIGQGISRAVAERMKSEHLKTELITNVSHDIKTPLTSIINYASLIADEPTENEKITEYSEVLVRQSNRMKKLLEDLLEASKATTGNLEVDLKPCEVSVILSQAIGEYQQRMEEKQLELIVTQPEQPVNIMADGRHLWRVFDNLLNNICKYAREDSRVYLNVEADEVNVSIIFRNMSKYALNITPEELQERFVRGDRSRHMDGNGLGLSIAKSLAELQNGRMEIVTDGDLFKVSLHFEMI